MKSHADRDDPQFYSIAMQVAAKAARAGQSKFAQELRDLIDELRKRDAAQPRVASVVPVVQPRGELGSLLAVSYPDARPADLVLSSELNDQLRHFLLEQRQCDVLRRHGLHPVRRVLLLGPPGTGKTSTARVIAGELGLPLYSIRLDTIITKYMGETAAKLRLIFDALAETRGVYLFDEVDALAGDRAARTQRVGSMAERDRPHIVVPTPPASEPFTLASTGRGPEKEPFSGDRARHGRRLRRELDDALTPASDEPETAGTYITFVSFPGLELALESLDPQAAGDQPELVAVREAESADGTVQMATVYIPDGKKQYFFKRLTAVR